MRASGDDLRRLVLELVRHFVPYCRRQHLQPRPYRRRGFGEVYSNDGPRMHNVVMGCAGGTEYACHNSS
jgi:hypothetical protein